MSYIISCITTSHNLWLVLVAALICFSGSWATVRLFRRGRLAHGGEAIGWHFLTATAAGSAVWCTHFIAMLAYQPGVNVTFDPVLTIVSLLVVMPGGFAGFMIGGSLPYRWAPSLGGFVVGLSVAAMHYTGMEAYEINGIVEWDSGFILASVMIAALLGGIALHVASLDHHLKTKLVATVIFLLSVVGLHFTGMAALQITPMAVGLHFVDPDAMRAMAIAVALAGFIIVGAAISSYLIDGKTRAKSITDLRKMALSDGLTGLSNRVHFHEILDRSIDETARTGRKFVLAAIDLDRFKEINDVRGHSIGDLTLVLLAERMRAFAGPDILVARVGGDEFMLLLPSDSRADAMKRLSHLRSELIQPFGIDDFELSVGASIGACLYPDDASTKDLLINNTDLALYRAKAEPTEKICFFDQDMDEAVRKRRALANDLRQAIANHELELHYQVQSSVMTGEITGYEALLRWRHPERGLVPPLEFIPLAEENGLILKLGEWALREACQQFARRDPPVKVAVNLSPIQFLHPNLAKLVSDILDETGMPPHYLELELTESAIIADKARTLAILEQIRKLGVTFALDDFGTGYSSLETLRAFPFDKIKLDKSFMDEAADSLQARSIIRAVLALGKSLGIPVLAEGIETFDQMNILREEGCDAAQGYLLGKPAPYSNLADDPANQASMLRAIARRAAASETGRTRDQNETRAIVAR
jgi:diguanylate cyclase (GGDEF)-like protein